MRRGQRDLSLPFNWRSELGRFGVGLAWIAVLMIVWRAALFVSQFC